jgi:hypothetical protein
MKILTGNSIRISLWISIIAFAISLTQKTLCTESSISCNDNFGGWFYLLFGIFGIIGGGAYFTWLANPFIFLSWIFYKNNQYSLTFSFLAAIGSGSFLLFKEMPDVEMGGEITHYHMGYWLWLSSMTIMLIGNTIRLLIEKG